jgi:hypothetical protein
MRMTSVLSGGCFFYYDSGRGQLWEVLDASGSFRLSMLDWLQAMTEATQQSLISGVTVRSRGNTVPPIETPLPFASLTPPHHHSR